RVQRVFLHEATDGSTAAPRTGRVGEDIAGLWIQQWQQRGFLPWVFGFTLAIELPFGLIIVAERIPWWDTVAVGLHPKFVTCWRAVPPLLPADFEHRHGGDEPSPVRDWLVVEVSPPERLVELQASAENVTRRGVGDVVRPSICVELDCRQSFRRCLGI